MEISISELRIHAGFGRISAISMNFNPPAFSSSSSNEIVQYQEGPVIGLCRICQKLAKVNNQYDLECPKCGHSDKISRFVWDPTSQHPAT